MSEQDKCLFCPLCNKKFKTVRGRREHISNGVCELKNKKLTCQKCSVMFSTAEKLKYHQNNVVDCQLKTEQKKKIILTSINKNENEINGNKKTQYILNEINTMAKQDNTFISTFISKFTEQFKNILLDSKISIINDVKELEYTIAPAFLEMETIENIRKFYPDSIETAFTLLSEPGGLIKIIAQTICNPQHPIFNSVYMDDINSNLVKVSNGTEYVDTPIEEVLSKIVIRKLTIVSREIPDDHIDGEQLRDWCYHYTYTFTYAPNFIGDQQVERLELYKDCVYDFAKVFCSMPMYINSVEWKIKLNEDMKEFRKNGTKSKVKLKLSI